MGLLSCCGHCLTRRTRGAILPRMRPIPLLAAITVAGALLAACASPASRTAPTLAVSPTHDQATLLACQKAAEAGDANGAAVEELGRQARGFAADSDVDALREKAARLDDAPPGSAADNANAIAAAYDIGAWCITHRVG